MKIFVDDVKELLSNQTEVTVTINGSKLRGWETAKPISYCKKYIGFIQRLSAALLVLKGKAVAMQFFEDLTNEEQIKYVAKKLSINNKINTFTFKTLP